MYRPGQTVSSVFYYFFFVAYHATHPGTCFRGAQKIPPTRFQKITYNVDVLIGKVVQSHLEDIKEGMMRCYLEFAQFRQEPDVLFLTANDCYKRVVRFLTVPWFLIPPNLGSSSFVNLGIRDWAKNTHPSFGQHVFSFPPLSHLPQPAQLLRYQHNIGSEWQSILRNKEEDPPSAEECSKAPIITETLSVLTFASVFSPFPFTLINLLRAPLEFM